MDKQKLFDKYNIPDDERLLTARFLDKAQLCMRSRRATAAPFCNPACRTVWEDILRLESDACLAVSHCFFGGYPGAERTIPVFAPDYTSADEEAPQFLALLRASLSEFDRELTHRDYLGALMAAGISRESVGDILPDANARTCDIFLLSELADFVLQNLECVGRATVKLQRLPLCEAKTPEIKFTEIKDTVMSLRIDGVLSGGFKISRAEAAELIRKGLVQINHRAVTEPDKKLEAGDLISLRGKGRVLLKDVGGLTKKGRIPIVLAVPGARQ